jgi:hypothetical protein
VPLFGGAVSAGGDELIGAKGVRSFPLDADAGKLNGVSFGLLLLPLDCCKGCNGASLEQKQSGGRGGGIKQI